MIQIRVKKGEAIEKAIKRLKKSMDKEGIIKQLRAGRYFESALQHGSPSQASHDDYTQRLADLKERQRLIRERGVQIDPTGRVFDAADYAGRFEPTE